MTKWVRFLLIANVVIFFVQSTQQQFGMLFAFRPTVDWLIRNPWTLVTYMFLHGGIGHIFFNMLGLFFFGSRVEDRLGSDRFITLYFIGGIVGGLFGLIFPSGGIPVVGASGALYAVMLAYAWFWPRDRIMIYGIIPIEARILVLIYTVMSVMGLGGGGGTAHYAHLGGFVGGFAFLWFLRHNQGAKKFRAVATAPKIAPAKLGNWQKVDPKKVHEVNRDEVNRILDKISASGIESLTPDELRFLMNFVPPDDRPPVVH
jgi:membrane associated rhomboid family serine protease